jgi:hypothetical protein
LEATTKCNKAELNKIAILIKTGEKVKEYRRWSEGLRDHGDFYRKQ